MGTEDRLRQLRQLYESGQYHEAWKLYVGDTDSECIEWHWYGSLAAWRVGRRAQSRAAAERGVSLGPTGAWSIKFLHRLGVAALSCGDSGVAIRHLETCLQHVDAYPDLARFLRGVVLYNLGLAWGYRWGDPGSQQKAVDCYRRAADEFRREDLRDHLRSCLQNLAWAALTLGQAETALVVLSEADMLCETDEHRAVQAVTEAFLVMVQGHHHEAIRQLKPWLEEGTPPDARVLAHCVGALAAVELLDLDQGMVEAAKRLADNAVLLAHDLECSDQTCVDAQYVQRRVYEAIRRVRGA